MTRRRRGNLAARANAERRREREEQAQREQDQLELRRGELATVERNLAISGVAAVAGAFVHFWLAVRLLRHASGFESLFSPRDPSPFIGLLLFGAGALRILAGPYLWWVEPIGRVLYVIGAGLTSFAVAKLFMAYTGAVHVFLLLIFPPLVIAALLFSEPASGLFGDEQFQTAVKLRTRSQRSYDGVFWLGVSLSLLLAAYAIHAMARTHI